jgi:hypothetical protein
MLRRGRQTAVLIAIFTCLVLAFWIEARQASLHFRTVKDQHGEQQQDAKHFGAGQGASSIVEALEFFDEHNGAVTAAATIFVALFTIVLGVVAYQQIGLSRSEFIATHRPRLRIRSVRRFNNNQANNIKIRFNVVNVGNSTAQLIGSNVLVDFFNDKPPVEFDGENVVEPRRFLAGASDSYIASSARRWIVLQSQYQQSRFLFAYGWIVYRDDLNTTYTTSFCRIWNLAGNRFARTDDPDYEYED